MGSADRYEDDERRRYQEWLASLPWHQRALYRLRPLLVIAALACVGALIVGVALADMPVCAGPDRAARKLTASTTTTPSGSVYAPGFQP